MGRVPSILGWMLLGAVLTAGFMAYYRQGLLLWMSGLPYCA